MIFLILVIVVGLVFWALRLMDRAVENQEFSLMLAGFLVASSAAAMVGVYFLMSDYLIFMTQTSDAFDSYDTALIESELPIWLDQPSPYSQASLSTLQESSDLPANVRSEKSNVRTPAQAEGQGLSSYPADWAKARVSASQVEAPTIPSTVSF